MTTKAVGVTALEEKHMIAVLMYLRTNGPSRKIDIYNAVSTNPRMPDKLNALESLGLVDQEMDVLTRSTVVSLTPSGEHAANMLAAIDTCIKGAARTRAG